MSSNRTDSVQDCATEPAFPLFGKLPTEIRFLIWKLAATNQARRVEITDNEFHIEVSSPAALLVNSESETISKEVLSKLFDGQTFTGKTHEPECDSIKTLELEEDLGMWMYNAVHFGSLDQLILRIGDYTDDRRNRVFLEAIKYYQDRLAHGNCTKVPEIIFRVEQGLPPYAPKINGNNHAVNPRHNMHLPLISIHITDGKGLIHKISNMSSKDQYPGALCSPQSSLSWHLAFFPIGDVFFSLKASSQMLTNFGQTQT
ncbi:predicted protein [Sclerotinia sclerotiorum 1980 UF-70]|uniref:2EXR domain-containing protein n=1 Tax=Sclerotinia sclerotiorum (strain ATCC 18683 / 1980 / Ss-1) TaxID=665079 RepID=A7F4V4_SCLS1|nr:predicted protein [Sclerotinia sclerotiorum 1980 UF-70]EDN97775.1 predicted protein [Sclerotinia sclerotiorum 1980 UF-70]